MREGILRPQGDPTHPQERRPGRGQDGNPDTGGLYERFFEEVGEKVMDGEVRPLVRKDRPDMRRIVEVVAEYGIKIPVPIA